MSEGPPEPPAEAATPRMIIALKGRRFAVDSSHFTSYWQKVAAGAWEPETFAIFETFIRPGSTLIDVGAWIGPTVLFGATIAGRVLAFEPDPYALHVLKLNVEANPGLAPKIAVAAAALATKDGTVPIYNNAPGNSGTSLLPEFGYTPVRAQKHFADARAVDARKFLASEDLSKVSLIKIDVEGAEYDLVPYMAEAVARAKPTLHVSVHPFNLFFGTEAEDAQGRVEKTLALLDSLKGYRYGYLRQGGAMVRVDGPAAIAERVRQQGPALGGSFVVSEREAFVPAA